MPSGAGAEEAGGHTATTISAEEAEVAGATGSRMASRDGGGEGGAGLTRAATPSAGEIGGRKREMDAKTGMVNDYKRVTIPLQSTEPSRYRNSTQDSRDACGEAPTRLLRIMHQRSDAHILPLNETQ